MERALDSVVGAFGKPDTERERRGHGGGANDVQVRRHDRSIFGVGEVHKRSVLGSRGTTSSDAAECRIRLLHAGFLAQDAERLTGQLDEPAEVGGRSTGSGQSGNPPSSKTPFHITCCIERLNQA